MVRLTAVTFERTVHKIRKNQFLKKGIYKVPDVKTRAQEVLEARNIKVVTSDEILGIKKFAPKWEKPDNLLPDFIVDPLVEKKPVEHGTKKYTVTAGCTFMNGIDQACILTNTKSYFGTPIYVDELYEKFQIKNQDLMIQKAIMHSQLWNGTKDILPRLTDKYSSYKCEREYGIPDTKSATILLDNFLCMAGSLMKDFPSTLHRRLVYKPEVQTVFQWKDNKIQVNSRNECMILGDRQLPSFADYESIEKTVHDILPSMHPLSPTIDLTPMEDLAYEEMDKGALTEPVMYQHTVFRISGRNSKSATQNQAFNLINTYAIALAEARQRFGEISGDLPTPVCIQNINLTFNRVNFIYFQLNTYDTDNPTGVKNMAWFDSHVLFDRKKCLPWKNDNKYEPAKYGDFNPTGFKRFLAAYLYGLDETAYKGPSAD